MSGRFCSPRDTLTNDDDVEAQTEQGRASHRRWNKSQEQGLQARGIHRFTRHEVVPLPGLITYESEWVMSMVSFTRGKVGTMRGHRLQMVRSRLWTAVLSYMRTQGMNSTLEYSSDSPSELCTRFLLMLRHMQHAAIDARTRSAPVHQPPNRTSYGNLQSLHLVFARWPGILPAGSSNRGQMHISARIRCRR